MLREGDQLPDFSGLNHLGEPISHENYAGKKLIVFFYPRANTPGCTAEACNLRDNYAKLKAQGYELLGVSADNTKKQASFSAKYSFPYPLLADENLSTIKAFGVWGPKKFQGKEYEGIIRTTFVIDESGIIVRVINKVKTKDHAAQILEG
ncbi:MAG: thioredoxin-dependent thiol peroxidase [Flavobacteriaceae bacterium]|jgi:peroxiredoxin Q/BCP|tara:strand:+ start:13131 stop:13580 length:450 start_codon:yes stop_codon:yes gene_type:complete